jgi:hypothetical protein
MVERLADMAARAGLGRDAVAVTPDGHFVETVSVSATREQQLADIAELLGIGWLQDAARRLAMCLPSIGALLDAAPAVNIDDEPGMERLDDTPQALEGWRWSWDFVEYPARPGVYRRVEPGRVTHWLRRDHDTRRCERATAVYSRLRALLAYDDTNQVATVHREALPPDLHRRALTLCSGRLPVANNRVRLAFSDVPPDIADRVIRSLIVEDPE